MRDLITHIASQRAERMRIAESLDLLPYSDLQKLFKDYVEEKFDSYLHVFFSNLYQGIMASFRKTFSARLDILENSVKSLENSVLMAAVHPYGWVNQKIAKAAREFILASPGQKSTLHFIYQYIVNEQGLPLPGVGQNEKYAFLLRLLRQCDSIREIDNFLFEVIDHEVVEEREALAISDDYIEKIVKTTNKRMKKKVCQDAEK